MKKSPKILIFVAFSFLVGVLLRLWGLGSALGKADENQNILDYGHAPLEYIATSYFFGGHHILNSLFIRLSIYLFGEENAFGIRAPVFILSIATLWLVYLIALQIFRSQTIGALAVFAIAVNPTHIYYSQIARGYGWIIFFSALTLFSLLKLLETGRFKWEGITLLSGFLGIYTIPTNVYLILALGIWSLFITCRPSFPAKNSNKNTTLTSPLLILIIFVGIALLSFLAYLPILDNLLAEAKNYHLPKLYESSNSFLAIQTITGFFEKSFPGYLIWSLLFVGIGVFLTSPAKKEYFLLPFFLLGIPALITWTTGVGGYPRNYLFNLPWVVVFFAAGIEQAGQLLVRSIKLNLKPVLIIIWSFFSFYHLIFNFYPSQNSISGPDYYKLTESSTELNDLLVIQDSKNYLYSRQVYKSRLKKIIESNKLSGLKLISKPNFKWQDYSFSRPNSKVFPFKGFNLTKPTLKLNGNRFLYTISENQVEGTLPIDFESKTQWNIISGSGELNSKTNSKIFGEKFLQIKASEKGLSAFSVFPQYVIVTQPSLAILTWAGKNLDGNLKINHPEIAYLIETIEAPQQLPFVELNDGIHATLKESNSLFADNWLLFSNIAQINPGVYSITLWLKVDPNESYAYDGFRFFILPLKD
jgi:hypothetical protein